MISDLKTQGEWKVQLTIATNFFPFKDYKVLYILNLTTWKF